MRLNIGNSKYTKKLKGVNPSDCANRNLSDGIETQPCNNNLVANGRLKKTCAIITPWTPYIDNASKWNKFRIRPLFPKTRTNPSIATITGKIKGAPSRVIKILRPINVLLESARDTGIASNTLINADAKD